MTYKEWEQSSGNKVIASSPFSEKVFDFIPKEGRVLDLGCGDGRLSKIIKAHGFETYGMDINPAAINLAKAKPDYVGIVFSIQDAKSTTYEDDFFDAVIEQAVLACVEKSSRFAVLTEVYRILKPGGVLSIAEFGFKEDLHERYRGDALASGEYGTVVVKSDDGMKPFRSHHFRVEELDALIHDTGFEIIQSAHPNFITRSGNEHPGHQYIVRKIYTHHTMKPNFP